MTEKFDAAEREAKLAQQHSDLMMDRYMQARRDWLNAVDETFAAYDRVAELVRELEQELHGDIEL